MSNLVLPNQPQNDEEMLTSILKYLETPKKHFNAQHRMENMERILAAFTALKLKEVQKGQSLIIQPGR